MNGNRKFKGFFSYKANRAWSENITLVMQVGLTMVGCVVFCFFIGLYIDRWLGTRGVFLVIFTLLGVVGGANTVYRQIQDSLKERPSRSHEDTNGAGEPGSGKKTE